MEITVYFDAIWKEYNGKIKDIENHLYEIRKKFKGYAEENCLTLYLTKKSLRKGADLIFPNISDIKGSIHFIELSDRVVYQKDNGERLLLKERYYSIHYIEKSKVKLNRIKLKRHFTLNNYESAMVDDIGFEVIENDKIYFQTLDGYCFQINKDDYETID